MRRRSLLAAAAVCPFWKVSGQTSRGAGLGTIAWAEGGGLWLRELPDGRKLKIASADGLHAPRISPSGRWILYRNRDDRLFMVRSDGQAGTSVEGDAATWLPHDDRLATRSGVFAPDGRRFVFERDGQLCLGSLDTPYGEPEILVSNEDGEFQPYAWTRDGRSILYWSSGERSASRWSDGVRLSSVPAGGGSPRELGVSTLVHNDMLDLAPESAGNQLVVTRGEGRETWGDQRIAIANLDNGTLRNLTEKNMAAICPAWSPDGRSIACSAGPDANAAYIKSVTGANIRVLRPDGTVETKTVTPDMKIGVGGGEEAHVYLQQRKIWMLDPTGAHPPWQLTGDARYRDEAPLWSAGGSHILFGRMDYSGHCSLWLMERTGANATQVCRLHIADQMGEDNGWFGFYGYTDWRNAFDWRRAL